MNLKQLSTVLTLSWGSQLEESSAHTYPTSAHSIGHSLCQVGSWNPVQSGMLLSLRPPRVLQRAGVHHGRQEVGGQSLILVASWGSLSCRLTLAVAVRASSITTSSSVVTTISTRASLRLLGPEGSWSSTQPLVQSLRTLRCLKGTLNRTYVEYWQQHCTLWRLECRFCGVQSIHSPEYFVEPPGTGPLALVSLMASWTTNWTTVRENSVHGVVSDNVRTVTPVHDPGINSLSSTRMTQRLPARLTPCPSGLHHRCSLRLITDHTTLWSSFWLQVGWTAVVAHRHRHTGWHGMCSPSRQHGVSVTSWNTRSGYSGGDGKETLSSWTCAVHSVTAARAKDAKMLFRAQRGRRVDEHLLSH